MWLLGMQITGQNCAQFWRHHVLWALMPESLWVVCLHSVSDRTWCGELCTLQIDWNEPWLWFLVGFHLMCSLLTMITVIFNCHNTQIALFALFCQFTTLYLHVYSYNNNNNNQMIYDAVGMAMKNSLEIWHTYRFFGF